MSHYNCYHLRSDALLAMLIQLGYPAEAIDVDFNGDFRKKYTSGLESIAVEKEDVYLNLNENSIYDQLPEGLFHQSRGNAHNQSASSYIDEHKRYKREAKAARKFFNPLDQVLLFAKADARLKKESVLEDLIADESAFLSKLWGLEQYRNNKYFASFLNLLQNGESIKAQANLIADALATLLDCKVKLNASYTNIQETGSIQEELILGFNTCLEADDNESMLQWNFIISEIDLSKIDDFFTNRDTTQLLQLVEQFFIPIDILVNYEFEVPELQHLDKAILGISTL